MNRFEQRIVFRVLGIHAGVILLLALNAPLQGCFRREPKPQMVTYVEFGSPAPMPQVQEVTEMPEPEPEPAPEPVVRETPKPIPKPVPKPQPKPEPKKSDWKPTPVDQIKVGPKVKNTPSEPAISPSDIRKELSKVQETPTTKVGNPNENAAYDGLIHTAFYNAWTQPAVAAARPAEVTISITSTGRIKSWRLSRSSGDAEYDATVEAAVRAISILPKKPPAGYPLDNIVIKFSIN